MSISAWTSSICSSLSFSFFSCSRSAEKRWALARAAPSFSLRATSVAKSYFLRFDWIVSGEDRKSCAVAVLLARGVTTGWLRAGLRGGVGFLTVEAAVGTVGSRGLVLRKSLVSQSSSESSSSSSEAAITAPRSTARLGSVSEGVEGGSVGERNGETGSELEG